MKIKKSRGLNIRDIKIQIKKVEKLSPEAKYNAEILLTGIKEFPEIHMSEDTTTESDFKAMKVISIKQLEFIKKLRASVDDGLGNYAVYTALLISTMLVTLPLHEQGKVLTYLTNEFMKRSEFEVEFSENGSNNL